MYTGFAALPARLVDVKPRVAGSGIALGPDPVKLSGCSQQDRSEFQGRRDRFRRALRGGEDFRDPRRVERRVGIEPDLLRV